MNSNNIRFSRISRIAHPRATVWAIVLLVVVFLGFGVWAQAHVMDAPAFTPEAPELSLNSWQTHMQGLLQKLL